LKTINFSTYSSIRIGPEVGVKVIDDIGDFSEFYIIGGANNLLVSPNPPKLAILGKRYDFIKEIDGYLHIGGATKSGKILSFAKHSNIANFELMQKLPGTLGGMIKMNAGLKEWETWNHLVAIKTKDGWIEKSRIKHSYRHTDLKEIVFEAKFELQKGFDPKLLEIFKKFRDNQPQFPSAGSCFKNPPNNFAGKLLDMAGLKGKRVGNMGFSKSHANFLINLGGGTFNEAIKLIDEARKRVDEEFGVKLELEIEVLGHQT